MKFESECFPVDLPKAEESELDSSAITEQFLSDESKLSATSIARVFEPKNESALASVLRYCSDNKLRVSIGGGRTGVVGGAVPIDADVVVSLDKLKSIRIAGPSADSTDVALVVGAGVRLLELNEFVQNSYPYYYFPVNPTETWASVGGMVSTNASGSRSYKYGSIRNWVSGLRAILMDGSCIDLSRADKGYKNSKILELTDTRGARSIESFFIEKPATKNTIGYTFSENSNELDLLIGSEGTLAVVSEVTLKLCPKPQKIFTYLQFFPDEQSAFVALDQAKNLSSVDFLSFEFLCQRSLRLFCDTPKAKLSKLYGLAHKKGAAMQFKFDASGADLDRTIELLAGIVAAAGGDEADSYAGFDEDVGSELRMFRHAIPEAINSIIAQRAVRHPGLHKLSTDMAVPNGKLVEIFNLYRTKLESAKLEFAIFGHAGDNHLHVNILPRDLDELKLGKELYLEFARAVVDLGGAVSAEHGIGRIKRDFLKIQYNNDVISGMREIKRLFDPDSLLNIGVLFYE